VKSLYQVDQALGYIFLSCFWVNPYFWYLLFTGLHALNGMLVFSFFSKLFESFKLPQHKWVAIAGTLLFLFSPNITEVTVWKAGEHYLVGVMMQLILANWALNYLNNKEGKYVWLCTFLFAVSIFTLEIFYATPFITLFLIIGYYLAGKITKAAFKKTLFVLYLPQLVLFIFHLFLFRLSYGTWVAHYGSTNDFVWNLNDIISGYGKYCAYMVLDVGHLPFQYRSVIYGFMKQPLFSYTLLFIVFWGITIGLVRFKKISASKKLLTFLVGVLICSLTLVVTTYFDELFSLYNSRRCYQTSIFLYSIIAVIIFSLANKKIALIIFTAYFFFNFFLLEKMIFRWKVASEIQHSLVNNFKWFRGNPVLLLNIPTYFKDVRIMSANSENEFNTQSQIWIGDSVKGKLYEVSSFNTQTVWDGAHVTVIDSAHLKVTLNQWGDWWMYNLLGQSSYENELYKMDVIDLGHEYLLSLSQSPKNLVILYYNHKRWNKVNLNQKGEKW
jgi:hypothetical protein